MHPNRAALPRPTAGFEEPAPPPVMTLAEPSQQASPTSGPPTTRSAPNPGEQVKVKLILSLNVQPRT